MNRQTAFFFDLDDTLIDYEAAFEQASLFAFTSIHPDLDKIRFFQNFKYYCDEYWTSYENGTYSKEEYQKRRYAKAMEVMGFEAEKWEAAAFQKSLYNKVPEYSISFTWTDSVLTYLHMEDIPWGIISNGFTRVQRAKMHCLPVTPKEKYIFISEENGFEKPDPDYFRFVEKKSGVKNCVYIGNSLELDIKPAQAAGWRAIWCGLSGKNSTNMTPALLASFLSS